MALLQRLKTISKAALYTGLAAIAISPARAQNTPQITSVVNGASYQSQVSEGGLATVFGSNFASTACGASTLPFPTTLCDVSVDADGQRLPVIFANENQVNFQLPYGPGARNLKVVKNGVESNKVPVDVLARAPGFFMYSTTTPEGKVQFKNLASALLGDYSLHGATNPVSLGTFNQRSSIAFYMSGLGTPVDGVAPALGMPAPVPLDGSQLLHVRDLDVYLNGAKVPRENISFTGYAPGLIIHQMNVIPPSGTPTGAITVRACTTDPTPVCSQDVTVFMTSTNDYVVGNLSGPGLMSDKKTRSLDSVVGTAKSDAGTSTVTVSNGNYLAPASGTTELSFAGNPDWESYKDTVTAKGDATVVPPIPAFPHVVYTDVSGPGYDRSTHTFSGQVRNPTLFDMVHHLSTSFNNPSCSESVWTWARGGPSKKVLIDPSSQPFYSPTNGGVCPTFCGGTIPADAVSGADVLWQGYDAITALGGASFQRVTYGSLQPDEADIVVKFDPSILPGFMGATSPYPQPDLSGVVSCSPITHANTSIATNIGTMRSLGAVGRHEARRTGYGSSGQLSIFSTDNMLGNVNDSTRDLDGTKMVEFLGYGIDLSKYAK